ncbi:hypothetical protein N309_10279, partial [Tinamus guttatus]
WYTVLDLKDAFFTIPLTKQSQEMFAFEWEDPESGYKGQLTWTRLPQGFKNSPTLFNEILQEDLSEFRRQNPSVKLLQYVDDLLLAARTKEECEEGTRKLLQELNKLGYRVSAKKAQLCSPEVTYLGYKIRDGRRWLTDAMKETVLRIQEPRSPREVREFLGTVGYCHLWIPGFAEKAKPLYEASREKPDWQWTEAMGKSFEELRLALLEAPALALPDPAKDFHLYV